jgi:hypothetical protein
VLVLIGQFNVTPLNPTCDVDLARIRNDQAFGAIDDHKGKALCTRIKDHVNDTFDRWNTLLFLFGHYGLCRIPKLPIFSPHLHSQLMNIAIPTPPPERLPVEVKHKPKQTPQRNQPHIRHNRRHKPALLHPRRDELRKPIPPDVLVDRDSDHERASDGFVRVDGVGGEHAGEGGDLDAGAGVADDDDGLPIPFVLVAEGNDEVAEHHYEDVGDWIEKC